MSTQLATKAQANIERQRVLDLPAAVALAGERAQKKYWEFFAANIRNPNTRAAYMQAVRQFFAWCEERGIDDLNRIEPLVIAGFVEELLRQCSAPTVKLRLAGIRMLFDWFVVNGVVQMNPASSVRGPKYVVRKGKTPVLTASEARELLNSIDTSSVVGLRDRALVAVMVYSFARIGATVGMKIEDYYQSGKRCWLRLHEKGGKFHEVPAHHNAEAYLDEYIEAAGIAGDKKGPLFRTTVGKTRKLTDSAMSRSDALRMVKRRASAAGLSEKVCCHTFRATGITAYLQNGGTIEKAQAIAAHESPRTTKLYDRTVDEITLDEVERILI